MSDGEGMSPYEFNVAREQIQAWAAECVELIQSRLQKGDPPAMIPVTMATACAAAIHIIGPNDDEAKDATSVLAMGVIIEAELAGLRAADRRTG